MRPGKEILFRKFTHQFHSLKITFKNSTKVGSNIYDAVNAAEITDILKETVRIYIFLQELLLLCKSQKKNYSRMLFAKLSYYFVLKLIASLNQTTTLKQLLERPVIEHTYMFWLHLHLNVYLKKKLLMNVFLKKLSLAAAHFYACAQFA